MLAIAPLSAAEPIRVLVFTTTDCPISNRYAPEIQRLAAKFDGQAKFVLVYPVPTDSPELIREHHKKFGYSIESMRDTDQKLVKQTGVTVTPEVAVMTRQRRCCIAAASTIATSSSAGSARKPTTHDLEDALDAVDRGQASRAVAKRAPIGCILSDLVK